MNDDQVASGSFIVNLIDSLQKYYLKIKEHAKTYPYLVHVGFEFQLFSKEQIINTVNSSSSYTKSTISTLPAQTNSAANDGGTGTILCCVEAWLSSRNFSCFTGSVLESEMGWRRARGQS
ncbi:hypothetical protein Ahy_B05g074909 [Arachis hypogaea]|uniref:Uncharacterized protein n=1 Tax=Arachis hypogaea TaxID=3818 RepID=A0A444Z035_ARAHY|nr:hypothetical protein Ahy_B05g074909 [Arachis hypogaea]